MFTQESSKQLSAFEVKYETEKKEIENQLLKQENETKSRNQWILITLVSVLLVLTILLIYFVRLRTKSHKQQKALNEIELSKTEQEKQHLEDKVFAEKQINRLQKDKYSSELEHKSSQLANSTLSLINKNEVLRKLKSEIVAVNGNGSDFSEILNIINQNLDLDIDWNKFKVEFEEAHPQFFERLYKAYPNLSETYIKICAYIRIDLTSREIADLLHVSQAAVNKNRQRMRKMLALEAEADLGLFLKEL
jgi:flagellar basal body-associated protein FliL/DNA-binding CsgD family transcriptional regulator